MITFFLFKIFNTMQLNEVIVNSFIIIKFIIDKRFHHFIMKYIIQSHFWLLLNLVSFSTYQSLLINLYFIFLGIIVVLKSK